MPHNLIRLEKKNCKNSLIKIHSQWHYLIFNTCVFLVLIRFIKFDDSLTQAIQICPQNMTEFHEFWPFSLSAQPTAVETRSLCGSWTQLEAAVHTLHHRTLRAFSIMDAYLVIIIDLRVDGPLFLLVCTLTAPPAGPWAFCHLECRWTGPALQVKDRAGNNGKLPFWEIVPVRKYCGKSRLVCTLLFSETRSSIWWRSSSALLSFHLRKRNWDLNFVTRKGWCEPETFILAVIEYMGLPKEVKVYCEGKKKYLFLLLLLWES